MLTQLAQPNPSVTPFEPILTIGASLEELARKLHFRLEHGEDDLDSYQVAHLVIDAGTHFLLVHYSGMPPDITEVFVLPPVKSQSDTAWRIVDALGVPRHFARMRTGTDFE